MRGPWKMQLACLAAVPLIYLPAKSHFTTTYWPSWIFGYNLPSVAPMQLYLHLSIITTKILAFQISEEGLGILFSIPLIANPPAEVPTSALMLNNPPPHLCPLPSCRSPRAASRSPWRRRRTRWSCPSPPPCRPCLAAGLNIKLTSKVCSCARARARVCHGSRTSGASVGERCHVLSHRHAHLSADATRGHDVPWRGGLRNWLSHAGWVVNWSSLSLL